MKKGFTTFLSALKANTPPCKKGHPSLRFLSLFLILFLAVGNVWGDNVTLSAADMVAGSTKSHITPDAGAEAAINSGQQVWLDGSTKKKYDVLPLSSGCSAGEALSAIKAKSVFFTIDEGYKISGLSICGASNKDASNSAPIVLACWTGTIGTKPALITKITLPHRQTSSLPSVVAASIPDGTKVIALYRRVKVNNITTPTELVASGGSDYGSGYTGNLVSVTISYEALAPATKHTVTYDLNGGTGTTPTQADVAEGAKFTLHNGITGITAPSGQKFDGWHDGTTKYAGGAEYTMGTSNVTLTAQWVENVPDPTASFADATYIIGQSALDMSAKFTSNSSGSVTYSLKEATSDASITSAGSFTATVAGTYVVVASQEAVAGTYAAISKEATVTVLDNELSDIFIWNKNSSHGGDGKCVTAAQANQNVNANQASTTLDYSSLTMSGITTMGRAGTANTDVELTFTAEQEGFAIKSICAFGKLEEPGGAEYSWDNGTTWSALAQYNDQVAKTFNAPAGEFPETFKLRFTSVSTSSGGLWWRNALVTLEMKKTVSSVTETLTNVKVNDVAIDAADLATLMADKSLAITTTYATAPTVTFVKQVTTSYSGGWPDDVTSEEIDVEASDITNAWSASATINAQTYTVTLAKPAGPSLETEATAFTLTSAKVATDTKSFTFSGVNLGTTDVTISLENAVAGMTVTPTVVTPEAGAITDQEVTITYKSLEAVAEANVNLVVYYDADTKITIPLTYSSTAGIEDLTSISAATTWNWDGAASAAVGTVVDKAQMIILANADVTWDEGFNAHAIAGKLEHMYRENKYAQGGELMFKTTIPGKVYVTYSNTGSNDPRTVNVNGTKGSLSSSNNKDADKRTESFAVTAGDVLIKGVQVSDDAAKYLRYYEVRFAPVFAVTYAAGDGAVKSGETLPTQADEVAGEKITLAAATVLEKDGYDFAGWLCNIDGVTYNAGDEYTMTAAATTFTAQWVEHVDPVDPTLTYDNGAYMTGGAALDLSTLITASTSTGAITYSVKDAGTTGATIDSKNFTATAAGTAVITASQAAILGYNAITVDFEVVVTEATEIDGIKMVEAGALTGNFRIKADQLKTGDNTVEGINYTKYVQMSSTHTSFSGETEGSQSKGIYYAPAKKNIKFWFYMRNTDSSARKIYIYKMEEGSAVSSETVSVDAGSHLVSYDMTLSTNAEVIFGVENTKLCFCQIVAVESGDDLLQGGQNGYVFDYSKKRQNVAKETLRTIDGIDYYLYADSKINSASNVQLNTLGTHYIKFHLNSPMTVKVSIDGTKQYYIGTECSTDDAAKEFSATKTAEFSLTAGDWYINAAVQVKVTKLEFLAPKCEEPQFNALANSDICSGDPYVALDGTGTVTDEGTVTYKWYAEGGTEVLVETATYTPKKDGAYYVVATNSLAGYTDNVVQSEVVTVTTHTGAAITAAPENVRMDAGETAILTVAATGKAPLTYQWYTCDENGDNAELIGGAEAASYEVTVGTGVQYYKVVVSSGCGDPVKAVVKVEEWTELPQANVTESITWDWTVAAMDEVKTADENTEYLMANVSSAVPNNENFRSDMLLITAEYANRNASNKCFQGWQIRFYTEVPGKVSLECRAIHEKVSITINGTVIDAERGGSMTPATTPFFVPAGWVTIVFDNTSTGEYADEPARVQKIVFNATPDYTREVRQGYYGTICLPNGGVMVGASLFGLSYYNEAQGLLYMDEADDATMVAGIPYIFLPSDGVNQIKVYYTDEENAAAKTVNGLVGYLDNEDMQLPGDGTNYILKDNKIKKVVGGNNSNVFVTKNRAYIQLGSVDPNEPAPVPGRRRVAIGQAPQVATGMESVDASAQPVKTIINGQLFILRGEKMYDAQGKLVK